MSAKVIIWAFLIFLAAFMVHVFVWRVVKPKAQIAFLFGIFFFVPLAAYGVLLIFSNDRIALSLAFLLYLSVAAVYVQTYPAIQANCPSLFIVHVIGKSQQGLGISGVQQRIEKIGLTSLDERVKDLFNDRLIATSADETVTLTGSGKLMVWVIVILRKYILGLKEGEG